MGFSVWTTGTTMEKSFEFLNAVWIQSLLRTGSQKKRSTRRPTACKNDQRAYADFALGINCFVPSTRKLIDNFSQCDPTRFFQGRDTSNFPCGLLANTSGCESASGCGVPGGRALRDNSRLQKRISVTNFVLGDFVGILREIGDLPRHHMSA